MRKLRVYVDTSVFGGVEDEEFATASKAFFAAVREGRYAVLISNVTLDELTEAPAEVRQTVCELPEGSVVNVPNDAEARQLAEAYIAAGALGEGSREDAAHVAMATVAGADLLLSWNFRHIVNYNRIRKFNSVNAAYGYRRLEIRSPREVGCEEEEL